MWEYTIIKTPSLDDLKKTANKLGEKGWEGFGFSTTHQGIGWGAYTMVLKRRIDSKEKFND